jgi:hypothetical protein
MRNWHGRRCRDAADGPGGVQSVVEGPLALFGARDLRKLFHFLPARENQRAREIGPKINGIYYLKVSLCAGH